VGNQDRARAHREALGQLTGAPARTQHYLARIDEALEQGRDASEILEEALEGDDAAELRRIRARCGGGDPARYVAEHARY
jgi:hypothetical protein